MNSAIDSIETIPFRLKMREPVEWGGGVLDSAEHVLVRITDSDGAVGVAEAIPRPTIYGETIGSVMSIYDGMFRPRFLGRSIWDRVRYWTELEALVGNHTAKGAFDLALADLNCRRLGISCHRYLGGYRQEHEVTQVLGWGDPGAVAAEAAQLRGEYGIKSFKLKAGHDLVREVQTIRRVRDDQPDAFIYVDANHGFDVLQALEFGRRIADLDVAWVEEPVPAERVVGRERLARANVINVFADESVTTPSEVAREVLAGRAHLVSLKAARTGYLASEQIRAFCEMTGVPLVMGNQGDSGVGTYASLAFGAASATTTQYPGEYGWILKLEDDLLAEPVTIEDGRIRVPEGPGNGVEIDGEKLKQYRID